MAKKKKPGEDESTNENQGGQSDDTFGLPEIEYEPIQREESTSETTSENQPVTETTSYSEEQPPAESEYRYTPPEEPAPVWPKILGILLVVVIALGALWYFLVYQPNQKVQAEKERLARIESDRLKKEQDAAEQLRQQQQAVEQRRLDSLAAIPKTGSIETLSGRTGRYYVVIASAVDDDLLMDYAKKLSDKGVSTKLIPPFWKYKVFRLTIADGDTFASAQETANGFKAEYGDALWVLKY